MYSKSYESNVTCAQIPSGVTFVQENNESESVK